MKKISKLSAAEFPGINEVKFNEWKEAVKKANQNTWIAMIVLVILNIFSYLFFKSVILGGILLVIVLVVINNKPNKLLYQDLDIVLKQILYYCKYDKRYDRVNFDQKLTLG
jgi:hypothetical protein